MTHKRHQQVNVQKSVTQFLKELCARNVLHASFSISHNTVPLSVVSSLTGQKMLNIQH